ncbi:putative disease resistance protein RGA3 isoform X2 [Triticum aestivum]|nr:putative disease resistance protein RGA3 isoform X2 [Triticum aestivum]
MEVEGNADHCAFLDFYNTTVQGSFNKVNVIQERMNSISGQLGKMKLYGVTPGFDKSVRPDTTPFPNEKNIFGRDEELKEVMGFLGVPQTQSKGMTCSKRKRASSAVNASTSTSARNQVNESRIPAIPVLPIVGMGGVGKTTLAQHICNHQQVKDYFELIIWICADDFDVKRLIKDAIQSASGKKTKLDHLASLQHALSDSVSNKRFLIVVDDVWDDALKENEQRWKDFYDSLTNVVQGSMMLVTTRFPDVADRVHTMEPIPLAGLKEDVFWDFFKLCAFGSESSENDPELERIGKSIVPKLKGSPLAAKTLGRLLGKNLHTTHWNNILENELWNLEQERTDILPALRLSYIYLPFHLKRCFSFCAVYAKDHRFEKGRLAEIWVAEGFVEPQGNTPLEDIGHQYFDDLVNRSFFQQVRGTYVIHDLLHDMAKLVSGHDCFTIRNMRDIQMVPENVRHLYILPSRELSSSNLLSLSKRTKKLRTLICDKSFGNEAAAIMDRWCSELQCLRVIFWASSNELPDSIANLKHLRYLDISKDCPFKSSSAFCSLYNLQRLYVEECNLESLAGDFSKLISLRGFKSRGFQYYAGREQSIDATNQCEMKLYKNFNQFDGHMDISNLGSMSKDHAAEFKLKDKKYLRRLALNWSWDCSPENREREVLQVLQPTTSLKSLFLFNYPDVSLPNWFQPRINLNEIPDVLVDNNNDEISTLSSLEELSISWCQNLRSVEQLLRPAYVPAIKKLRIFACNQLVSLPTETFGDFNSLEKLDLDCPNICSRSLVAHSLLKLKLGSSRNLTDNIQCCSLTEFYLSCDYVMGIQPQTWNLPALQKLHVKNCRSLTIVGQGRPPIRAFESLTLLIIDNCENLKTIDGLLTEQCLPAIRKIDVRNCGKLLLIFGETPGSLPSLGDLLLYDCPTLRWPRELVLPSSLKRLHLVRCGDISSWYSNCLQNFKSLVELVLVGCPSITSIPLGVCRNNLTSLDELYISGCPDLVSIGGAKAVAKLKYVRINDCPKMEGLKQPLIRGRSNTDMLSLRLQSSHKFPTCL